MHICLQIFIGIAIAVGAVFIIWIGKCIVVSMKKTRERVHSFFGRVNLALGDIESMKREGAKRKQESLLNIDGMFIIMKAMKGGEINGNVDDLEDKYKKYLKEEAV